MVGPHRRPQEPLGPPVATHLPAGCHGALLGLPGGSWGHSWIRGWTLGDPGSRLRPLGLKTGQRCPTSFSPARRSGAPRGGGRGWAAAGRRPGGRRQASGRPGRHEEPTGDPEDRRGCHGFLSRYRGDHAETRANAGSGSADHRTTDAMHAEQGRREHAGRHWETRGGTGPHWAGASERRKRTHLSAPVVSFFATTGTLSQETA